MRKAGLVLGRVLGLVDDLILRLRVVEAKELAPESHG
jgi:hypothetical protein